VDLTNKRAGAERILGPELATTAYFDAPLPGS
jgi:hypothetical protein